MLMLFLWKCLVMALLIRSPFSCSFMTRFDSEALTSSFRRWKMTLPSSSKRNAPSRVAKFTKPQEPRSRYTKATRPHCEKKSPTSSSLSRSLMPPMNTLQGSESLSKLSLLSRSCLSFRRGVAKPIAKGLLTPWKCWVSTTAQSASAANL